MRVTSWRLSLSFSVLNAYFFIKAVYWHFLNTLYFTGSSLKSWTLYFDESQHSTEIIYYLAALVSAATVVRGFISGCAFPLMISRMPSRGIGFTFVTNLEMNIELLFTIQKNSYEPQETVWHTSPSNIKLCVCVCVSESVDETGRKRTWRGAGVHA